MGPRKNAKSAAQSNVSKGGRPSAIAETHPELQTNYVELIFWCLHNLNFVFNFQPFLPKVVLSYFKYTTDLEYCNLFLFESHFRTYFQLFSTGRTLSIEYFAILLKDLPIICQLVDIIYLNNFVPYICYRWILGCEFSCSLFTTSLKLTVLSIYRRNPSLQ